MQELNVAISPISWKNIPNYLERIEFFTIFAACSLNNEDLLTFRELTLDDYD